MTLLEVRNLSKKFPVGERFFFAPPRWLHAVRGVDFSIRPGSVFGFVGESGSGKSVTMLSMMGLIRGRKEGTLHFKGARMEDLSPLRGRDVSMVFQNPLNSLNPSLRIGKQLTEVLTEHLGLGRREAEKRVLSMMERLAVPEPDKLMRRYPFEYSGGMRQRVMIAMAMLCEPDLLIADEPTGNLDPRHSWDIVRLLEKINRYGTTVLLTTHNVEIVNRLKRRVITIDHGKITSDQAQGSYKQ